VGVGEVVCTGVAAGVVAASPEVVLLSAGPQAASNRNAEARHKAENEFFMVKPLLSEITQNIMPLKRRFN
jgi:hypothetical protein